MKKNNIVYFMIYMLSLILYFIPMSIHTSAATPTEVVPTPWVNDLYVDVGRLRYGFSESTFSGPVPDVNYMEPTGLLDPAYKPIRHIYSNKVVNNADLGKLQTTSAFNLVENETEYNKNAFYGIQDAGGIIVLGNPVLQAINNTLDPLNRQKIVAQGQKTASPDLPATVEMYINKDQSAVIHMYTIKNTSTETKTIYPLKRVDTELNGNDRVPVYSRGVGQGIYIETPQTETEKGYRLDYYTTGELERDEHFPTYYAAHHQSGTQYESGFVSIFGPMDDIGNTVYVREAMEADVGTEIPIVEPGWNQNPDSGIFMSWGKVTLAPGESYTARYDVGITVQSNTKKSKTAKNITSTDGKNYVGDEIEYTIAYESKEYLSNIRLTDKLSEAFEHPTEDVTLTDVSGNNGNPTTFPISEVYDKNTRTLTIPADNKPGLTLNENGKFEVKFKVKLGPDSAGASITNTVNVTAKTEEETTIEEEFKTDKPLEIENSGKVFIKYQDENGNELHADDQVEGVLGSSYDLNDKKLSINGYDFSHTIGNATGTIAKDDQTVIFVYTPHTFDLMQEVFDATGANADGGSAAMGDKLSYKTTVTSKLQDTGDVYSNFKITANVSPYLENISNIVVKTKSGKVLDGAVYDAASNTISITISDTDTVNSNEDIFLSYDGTVKNVFDVTIEADSTAGGGYSDPLLIGNTETSNKVRTTRGEGNLELKGPSEINFGQNEISIKNQEYPIISSTGDLTVTDNRSAGQAWSISVTLDKDFTNTTNNDVLYDILQFKTGNSYTSIPVGSATPIISNKVTSESDRGKEINITQDWINKKEGLVLKVPGGMAKKGTYTTDLTWTLFDTPDNK